MSNLFTVDQVASKLDLHSRTVRRYIKEGQLVAAKVGGQWRISESEIARFTGENVEIPDSQVIESFEVNQDLSTDTDLRVSVSSVVEISGISKDESSRITNSLIAGMNHNDPSLKGSKLNMIYNEKESKAKFLLWGSVTFIQNMLEFLNVLIEE